MKISSGKPLLKLPVSCLTFSCLTVLAIVLAGAATPAIAQDGNRWYQIEVTIFAHEDSNTLQERWPTDDPSLAYPDNTRRLVSLTDQLPLNDRSPLRSPATADLSRADTANTDTTDVPAALRSGEYRLPDALRDAFVALPATEHNFSQTNRTLNNSPAYRVLYHNAWRQPVMRAAGAIPIAIAGGRQFNDHHELEGTLTILFNPSRDRVLLDTNLWLARFDTLPPGQGQGLQLPDYPANLRSPALPATTQAPTAPASRNEQATRFYVTDVFTMRDSRAMRSNEFHYLDHPAIGVVVQVFPYEPPTAPANSFQGAGLPL